MGGAETPYGLRPATAEDFEFIFQLNKANMRRYVELLRGWDDAAERPARHPGRGPRRRPARHADRAQPQPGAAPVRTARVQGSGRIRRRSERGQDPYESRTRAACGRFELRKESHHELGLHLLQDRCRRGPIVEGV